MSKELAVKKPDGAELATREAAGQHWTRPRYDYRQLAGGDYELRIWMPGVPKAGVTISLEGDTLTVFGTRGDNRGEGWRPIFQELPEGDYRLSLTLNMKIDSDKISARSENGVLALDLPVAEEAKPREIAIT